MKIIAVILILWATYYMIQAMLMSDSASEGITKFTQEGIKDIILSIELISISVLIVILDIYIKEDKE